MGKKERKGPEENSLKLKVPSEYNSWVERQNIVNA